MSDTPPSKTAYIQKRLLQILILLILALPFAYFLVIYHQSSRVMYFRPSYDYWVARKEARCTRSKKKYIYADMQPGQTQEMKPLELSCEEALKLPQTHHYVTTDLNMKIHYVRYIPQEKMPPTSPILLYVPGITGNDMTGARYAPLAQRLGFELVVMELSNHGRSDDNQMGGAYGCREKADVLAVFEALAQENAQRPIFLAGTSMGALSILNAGPQLHASAYHKQLVAAALENPPTSIRDMLNKAAQEEGFPLFMADHVLKMYTWRTGFDLDSCAGLKQAAQFPFPALVQISAQDSLTPPWMAEKIYQALPSKQPHQFKLYPHGRHSAVWNGQPKVYEADLKTFWNQALRFHQTAAKMVVP